jgi:hypothetical protein
VAVRVVDRLEAVEVQVQQRERPAAVARALGRVAGANIASDSPRRVSRSVRSSHSRVVHIRRPPLTSACDRPPVEAVRVRTVPVRAEPPSC